MRAIITTDDNRITGFLNDVTRVTYLEENKCIIYFDDGGFRDQTIVNLKTSQILLTQ